MQIFSEIITPYSCLNKFVVFVVFFFFFFFLREAEFQDEARNSREGSAEGCFACLWGKGGHKGRG